MVSGQCLRCTWTVSALLFLHSLQQGVAQAAEEADSRDQVEGGWRPLPARPRELLPRGLNSPLSAARRVCCLLLALPDTLPSDMEQWQRKGVILAVSTPHSRPDSFTDCDGLVSAPEGAAGAAAT